MSLSPKSNSSENAIDNALNDIRSGSTGEVPDHNIKLIPLIINIHMIIRIYWVKHAMFT